MQLRHMDALRPWLTCLGMTEFSAVCRTELTVYFLMHDNDFQSSKDQVSSDTAQLLLFSSQYGKNDPIAWAC